ncbi:hypothetical protein [Nonomuraea salmonea]|uniref:hypothetical protein n=1 Tax=Nonomuraea salmonea TaxID=46181 RepID=UPI002FEBC0BB
MPPATDTATPDATSDATPASTARVPTVRIECLAENCPLVTVRVPGGDVLHYRDMSRGEEVSYFEPELDVVLTDAGTVRVTANGKPREQGAEGEREAFTVTSPRLTGRAARGGADRLGRELSRNPAQAAQIKPGPRPAGAQGA